MINTMHCIQNLDIHAWNFRKVSKQRFLLITQLIRLGVVQDAESCLLRRLLAEHLFNRFRNSSFRNVVADQLNGGIRCFFDAHVDRRIGYALTLWLGRNFDFDFLRGNLDRLGSCRLKRIGWLSLGRGFRLCFAFRLVSRFCFRSFRLIRQFDFRCFFSFLHFCVQRCLKLTKIDGRPCLLCRFQIRDDNRCIHGRCLRRFYGFLNFGFRLSLLGCFCFSFHCWFCNFCFFDFSLGCRFYNLFDLSFIHRLCSFFGFSLIRRFCDLFGFRFICRFCIFFRLSFRLRLLSRFPCLCLGLRIHRLLCGFGFCCRFHWLFCFFLRNFLRQVCCGLLEQCFEVRLFVFLLRLRCFRHYRLGFFLRFWLRSCLDCRVGIRGYLYVYIKLLRLQIFYFVLYRLFACLFLDCRLFLFLSAEGEDIADALCKLCVKIDRISKVRRRAVCIRLLFRNLLDRLLCLLQCFVLLHLLCICLGLLCFLICFVRRTGFFFFFTGHILAHHTAVYRFYFRRLCRLFRRSHFTGSALSG